MPVVQGKLFNLMHVRHKGKFLMSCQMEDDNLTTYRFRLGRQKPSLIEDLAFAKSVDIFYQPKPDATGFSPYQN